MAMECGEGDGGGITPFLRDRLLLLEHAGLAVEARGSTSAEGCGTPSASVPASWSLGARDKAARMARWWESGASPIEGRR